LHRRRNLFCCFVVQKLSWSKGAEGPRALSEGNLKIIHSNRKKSDGSYGRTASSAFSHGWIFWIMALPSSWTFEGIDKAADAVFKEFHAEMLHWRLWYGESLATEIGKEKQMRTRRREGGLGGGGDLKNSNWFNTFENRLLKDLLSAWKRPRNETSLTWIYLKGRCSQKICR
jgi:hypothetical protein